MPIESQYRFANISATKAKIFMKFEINFYKIVKNFLLIFRKDPSLHAPTRGKIMRARVSSRQNARDYIYASCVWVCARIFTKNHLIIFYYLINISLKFHKDPSFRCGDICKTVLTFKSHQFSMYFPYFHSYTPQKSSKMDNYWMVMKFCWNLVIKMYIYNGQKDTCFSL